MKTLLPIVVLLNFLTVTVHAIIITHGDHNLDIDFVNIGHAGNTADHTGFGSVNYNLLREDLSTSDEEY